MSLEQLSIKKGNQILLDEVIKIEPSDTSTSNDDTLVKSKKVKCCSIGLKVMALLIIIAVVLLFALLPNYIRSLNANKDEKSNTDPTNARLPGGA